MPVNYRIFAKNAHNGRYLKLHDVSGATSVPAVGDIIRIDIMKGGTAHNDYRVIGIIRRVFSHEFQIGVVVEADDTWSEIEMF